MKKRWKTIIPSILVCAGMLFGASAPFAQTRVGGLIGTDTHFTKDKSPYIAYEDIHIKAGVTLTVEPGVIVQFKAKIKDGQGTNTSLLELLVEGNLVAVGAAGDSVAFISAADEPESRDWQGIIVRDGGSLHLENAYVADAITGVQAAHADEVTIKHVSILGCLFRGVNAISSKLYLEDLYLTGVGNLHGTGVGVNLGEGSEAEIYNCFIVGAQNGVMLYNRSKANIHHSIISNSTRWGLSAKNSDLKMSHCSVTGNDFGIVLSFGANPDIHQNNIFQNGVADVWFTSYPERVSIDLTNNWWEKQDVADIQRAVLDGTRDPSVKAFAFVEPILERAVATDPKAQ